MAPPASPKLLHIGQTLFEWGTRTYVMGVINATPDSFSGDGLLDATLAAERACEMVEVGADLIDLGAESTRPGGIAVEAMHDSRPKLAGDVAELIEMKLQRCRQRAAVVALAGMHDHSGLLVQENQRIVFVQHL